VPGINQVLSGVDVRAAMPPMPRNDHSSATAMGCVTKTERIAPIVSGVGACLTTYLEAKLASIAEQGEIATTVQLMGSAGGLLSRL
jgi:hypothetical protein